MMNRSTNSIPELFLHIGPPKTGTSAVQYLMEKQNDEQILYPRVGLWRDGSHHNMVFNFFKDFRRPESTVIDLERELAPFAELARHSKKNILISSEALIGRDISLFVNFLMQCFSMKRDQVNILFTCREHLSRAASLYNQAVKDVVDLECRTPDEYLRQHARGLCYAKFIRDIDKAGLNVLLLNYHPEDAFVPRFLRAIGYDDLSIPTFQARNVSLSVKGLIATLAANNVSRSNDERDALFERLRKMRGFYQSSKLIFSRDTVREFKALFREDAEILRRDYGLDLPICDPNRQNHFHLTLADFQEIKHLYIGSEKELELSEFLKPFLLDIA